MITLLRFMTNTQLIILLLIYGKLLNISIKINICDEVRIGLDNVCE
jgi:hypothetical protein